MAQRAPTICRATLCRQYASFRGYCEQHKEQGSRWYDQHRKSSTQRGYGTAWRKLRADILQRDGYQCVEHRKLGKVVMATCVDHITPKSQGGTDNPRNLQSLCDACHHAKTKTETQRGLTA